MYIQLTKLSEREYTQIALRSGRERPKQPPTPRSALPTVRRLSTPDRPPTQRNDSGAERTRAHTRNQDAPEPPSACPSPTNATGHHPRSSAQRHDGAGPASDTAHKSSSVTRPVYRSYSGTLDGNGLAQVLSTETDWFPKIDCIMLQGTTRIHIGRARGTAAAISTTIRSERLLVVAPGMLPANTHGSVRGFYTSMV